MHFSGDRLLRLGETVGRRQWSEQRHAIQRADGPVGRDEGPQALLHHAAGIFARHRQHALALDAGLRVRAPQDRVDGLLDGFQLPSSITRIAFLPAQTHQLGLDQRLQVTFRT